MYKRIVLSSLICIPFIAYAADFPSAVSPSTEAIRAEAATTLASPEEKKLMVSENAEELADKFIEKLVKSGKLSAGEGWNDGENIYLSKGVAVFDVKGVSKADLMSVRAAKYAEATLNAKENIIKFVRTELSHEMVVTLPETGLSSKFDKELEALQNELERKTKAYELSLKEAGALKDEEVGGVNKDDFFRETIAAVINKIGGAVDISNLKKEQAAKVAQAKQELLALQSRIDELKKEIDKKREALGQTTTSQTETLASMVLSGAMVAAQFESLVNDQYQIVVLVTWSPKQESLLRGMFKGENLNTNFRGNQTIGQYIAGNDWSSAIGGRKFVDVNGDLHVIGIGAAPLRGNSSADRYSAEISAGAQARSQIALSFYGDTKVKEKAQQKLQELKSSSGGATETVNTESFSKNVTESVQGLQLQGVSKRLSKVMVHPLTGQKILVYIADMSIKNSKAAKDIENTNHQASLEVIQKNQEASGYKAGLNEAKERVERDSSNFQAGMSQGINPEKQALSPVTGDVPSTETRLDSNQSTRQEAMQGAGASESAFMF